MLEFENVSKSFWTGTRRKVILDSVSFRVELGRSIGILAPNGTGKTTLIKALVRKLGGKHVTSPTFSIVNEYEVDNDIVYHFDFYRIKDESEAYDIGIEDYFYSGHWVFIEWPEKITEILPFETDISYIKLNQNGSRTLKLEAKFVPTF